MKERNIKVFHKACNEYFIYEYDSEFKNIHTVVILKFIVGNKKDMTRYYLILNLIDLHKLSRVMFNKFLCKFICML